MTVYLVFVAQIGHGFLGPITIKERTAKDTKILGGYFVLPVDEVCLGQPFEGTAALIVIGNSFHGLEDIALGSIYHSQMVVSLGCRKGRSEVALELWQQAFGTVLIELEHAVAQLSGHGEREVETGDLKRRVGRLLLGQPDEIVPTFGTYQIIVGNGTLALCIKPTQH